MTTEGIALATPRPVVLARQARTVAGVAGCALLLGAGLWLAFAGATNNWIVDLNYPVPEPHWMLGPLTGIAPGLTDSSTSWLLALMLAGWLLGLTVVRRLALWVPVAITTLLSVFFTLTSPIFSADVFSYVAYGRMFALHGINPYLHGPSAAAHDPVLPYVYWIHTPAVYGPLDTLLNAALAPLGVAAETWSLKAICGVAMLVAIYFSVRAAKLAGRSPGRAAWFLANPPLIAYGVGGAHVDLLIAALCSVACFMLLRGRAISAGIGFAAAMGIKSTVVVMAALALAQRGLDRRRLLVGLLGGGLLLGAMCLAFGGAMPDSHVLTDPSFAFPFTFQDDVGRVLKSGVTRTSIEVVLVLGGLLVA
ncbi:MAG: DUF2029 domain-containing protein, partial [Solirubrobacterales bacterium]|nr:DUF2029 domain-containing protein [Solirubrobacterales bacterium]